MLAGARLTVFVLAGCSGGGETTAPPQSPGPPPAPPPVVTQPVSSLRLNFAAPNIAKGQIVRLVATPLDASGAAITGKQVSWTTSDAAVAKVYPSEELEGIAPGSAKVTASVDGKTAEAVVTVVAFGAIQPGMLNTCAITLAGRLYCAGADYGASTAKPVVEGLRFVSLTAHSEPEGSKVAHFCALAQDRAAYCWGTGSFGELGNGSIKDQATPTAVVGGIAFRSITAGQHHTCGLTESRFAACRLQYCGVFFRMHDRADARSCGIRVPDR